MLGKPAAIKVASMGDTRPVNHEGKETSMTDNQTSPQPDRQAPKNGKRRWAIAGIGAASIAALAAIGTGWHERAQAFGPGHHRGFMGGEFGGPVDPEVMNRRLDAMVSFALADVDATADQKSRIGAIARQAAADLAPMRKTHRDLRSKSSALLTQPTIDRAQLEALRAQQMQLGDAVSRRMLQAIEDAAEVLTPEQRGKLAQKWQARHGGGPR